MSKGLKADLKEMEELLMSNDREKMSDYLMTHRAQSAEEMRMVEKLCEKELSLRKTSIEETEKTKMGNCSMTMSLQCPLFD